MKNKDQKMLEEAYVKITERFSKDYENFDDNDDKTVLNTIPSDQEMQNALNQFWKKFSFHQDDQEYKNVFSLKSLKSFLEYIKEARDERLKNYPEGSSTLASVINDMYSDAYKEVNNIRMSVSSDFHGHLPNINPLIGMAFSYFGLYIEEKNTREERELGYTNREILYKKDLEISNFVNQMTEDSDLPSAVNTILKMIENAGFEKDNNNEYKNQLLDSAYATIKHSNNLSEEEISYLLSALPEKY